MLPPLDTNTYLDRRKDCGDSLDHAGIRTLRRQPPQCISYGDGSNPTILLLQRNQVSAENILAIEIGNFPPESYSRNQWVTTTPGHHNSQPSPWVAEVWGSLGLQMNPLGMKWSPYGHHPHQPAMLEWSNWQSVQMEARSRRVRKDVLPSMQSAFPCSLAQVRHPSIWYIY